MEYITEEQAVELVCEHALYYGATNDYSVTYEGYTVTSGDTRELVEMVKKLNAFMVSQQDEDDKEFDDSDVDCFYNDEEGGA